MKPYRSLAKYYEDLFATSRRPMDAARARILSRILPRIETACDLACGTGTTALAFARKGIKAYAVDLSPAMCRIARRKASRARLRVNVLRGDIRNFRLPDPVDRLTCENDALNHIPHVSDLRKVARAVHRALNAGGHFFFDVNNSTGFKRYWSGTVWIEKATVTAVMRNGHSPEADRAWSDIDLFIREGRCWRRYQERVEEVCWEFGEIRRVFKEAGFDQFRAWDAAPFFKGNRLITRGCRSIYLVRKPAA